MLLAKPMTAAKLEEEEQVVDHLVAAIGRMIEVDNKSAVTVLTELGAKIVERKIAQPKGNRWDGNAKLFYQVDADLNWDPKGKDPDQHKTSDQTFGSTHPARIGQYTTFLDMGSMDNVVQVEKSMGDTLWWTIVDIVMSSWGVVEPKVVQSCINNVA